MYKNTILQKTILKFYSKYKLTFSSYEVEIFTDSRPTS